MATAGNIKYHFLGFMSKCAEYGVTEPYVVGTLYKMALQRPVISRMGDTVGQNLGIENRQGVGPAIDAPGYYRPAEVTPRTPTGSVVENVEHDSGDDVVEQTADQSVYNAKPAPVFIHPSTPEYKHPDFDPRGGPAAPYFMARTRPGNANFHYSTSGDHIETGTADMTTDLTIDPADTQTDMQRRIMEEASN